MNKEDFIRITNEEEQRLKALKRSCDECVPNELIEWIEEVKKQIQILDILNARKINIFMLTHYLSYPKTYTNALLTYNSDKSFYKYRIIDESEFELIKEWLNGSVVK